MIRRVGEEKPDLEELAHHGVKGMHWGIRKARPAGHAPAHPIEHPNTQQIKAARRRQHALLRSYHKTARADKTTRAKIEQQYNSSQDRVTAYHMTHGEKVLALVLGGPIGLNRVIYNDYRAGKVQKSVDSYKSGAK